MVSVPGLNPYGQGVEVWWAGKDPAAQVFKYSGIYQAVTTVTPGEGYWMKHLGANVYNTGEEWPAIQIVPHDPISAKAGWNLIGGYEIIASSSELTTSPPGLIEGPVYGFSGTYEVADNLIPGYGYWIKLIGDGQIIIPEWLEKAKKLVEFFQDSWGKIIITDNADRSFILYTVNGKVDLSLYELPPVPPSGMFDIRYESGRIAEDINQLTQIIQMTGIEHPIKVRIENMTIRLQDETGKEINEIVRSGEEITIRNREISILMISEDRVPEEFVLYQNYPNPFNPSTSIKFAIPKESLVSLSIYNVLGELLKSIVEEKIMKPGYYEYEFSAINISSGVYFYRIKAGDFIQSRKMVLVR
jgi:hypothetical protein